MKKNVSASKMKFEEFFAFVKKHLKLNGFKIIINDNSDYGGFLDIRGKLFLSKAPKKRMFQVLVHEYAHFCYLTKKYVDAKVDLAYLNILNEFINGTTQLTRGEFNKCLKKVIDAERRCEIDGLKLIDDLSLDINKSEFINRANRNLWSYSTHYFDSNINNAALRKRVDKYVEIMPTKHFLNLKNLHEV